MIQQFHELYGDAYQPRVFRAPGRVNLIGEHTDYNDGFVMPIALNMSCYVATAPAMDGKISIYTLDYGEFDSFDADVLYAKPLPNRHWTNYVIGVAQQLARRGVTVHPAKMMLHSQVPEGAGLSSSAALEVSSALAFLNGRTYGPVEIAKLARAAENDFVGVPSGIMDQYISVFGQDQRAVEIDCRSLEFRLVELPRDAVVIAVNSEVKHQLASSAYADRVKECAEAVSAIQKQHPAVIKLRDVKLEWLDTAGLTDKVFRRARHIVTENIRVEQFRVASQQGNLAEMGKLFLGSHESMKKDYEITCEEIDFLVEHACEIDGVYGARMTGGGFGGCTVNLMRPDAAPAFEAKIKASYKAKYNVDAVVFPCIPSKGAEEVKNFESIPPAPSLKK